MTKIKLRNLKHLLFINCMMIIAAGCSTGTEKSQEKTDNKLQLITLDPGHFHSALVQKSMYEDSTP